jgi:hypothetical protein
MALTTTLSGQLQLTAELKSLYSGDRAGEEKVTISELLTFAAAGGDAPTISGFFKGTATCAAGDWLLAHASDPLGTMGTAGYNQGFTVDGTKLKLLFIKNLDTTNSITIIRGASNGLPIFEAAGDGITLAPGDIFLFYKKAGTAALTTTSNDKLTISVSAGSPTCTVVAAYGP